MIRYFREGKSHRMISRELGINRKTVKKYLDDYHDKQTTCKSEETGMSEYLSETPLYNTESRGKLRLTREVQEAIDGLMKLNNKKRDCGLHKQMLKKVDILDELHSLGFQIGYTTLCNYIRQQSGKTTIKEAFIRQTYLPGSTCEFDWGEVKLKIEGHQRRYYLAIFTSGYSNYRYAQLYHRQDTLAFMESHVSFFGYTGGHVYKELVYDNMRVAISRFVGKYEKEPTVALLALKGHYHFSHRFCNVYRGNEKGHVERSVEYVRRKAFSLKDDFENEDSAQEHLLSTIEKLNGTIQQLTGKTASTMFLDEKEVLHRVSYPLCCSDLEQLRVDKYATFSYGTNRYSVPDNLVGHFVDAKIFSQKIEVYQGNKLIAIHARNYNKHQWIISIEHYLDTFRRKPGALAGSVALVSGSYLKQLYEEYFQKMPQDFIDLLQYCYQHQIEGEKLETTVSRLVKRCPENITTEKIKALLGNKPFFHHEPSINDETISMAKNQLIQAASLLN